jgi:hypothetical protein
LPLNGILLFGITAFSFIMINNMNILAPIVTMPYLLTYGIVCFANFAFDVTIEEKMDEEMNLKSIQNKKNQFEYISLDSNNNTTFNSKSKKNSMTTSLIEKEMKLFDVNEKNQQSYGSLNEIDINGSNNNSNKDDQKFLLSFSNKWLSLIGVSFVSL